MSLLYFFTVSTVQSHFPLPILFLLVFKVPVADTQLVQNILSIFLFNLSYVFLWLQLAIRACIMRVVDFNNDIPDADSTYKF